MKEHKIRENAELWVLKDKASDIVERITKGKVMSIQTPFYLLSNSDCLCGLGQLFKSRNDAIEALIERLKKLIVK